MLSPEYDTNLHAATTVFWNALHIEGETALRDLLSPDCQYIGKGEGIECYGCDACIEKLTELKMGIIEFEKTCTKLRIGVKVNRRKKTSRFLISPLQKSFEFSLGVLLLWECGIIIGIKVIDDAPNDFLESSRLGRENARLSQAQNIVMRSRTGKSHYKWRQVAVTKHTGVVVGQADMASFIKSDGNTEGPRDQESPGTNSLNSKANEHGGPEEIFIPIKVDFTNDTQEPLHTSCVVINSDPTVSRRSVDDSAEETTNTAKACPEAIVVDNNKKRLRFDHTVTAALIQERCELPPEGVFYTALDIHHFTQDFAEEVREVARKHNVSYKEAIDIYYGRRKNSSAASSSTPTGGASSQSTLERVDSVGWYPGKLVDKWREGDTNEPPTSGDSGQKKSSGWYLGKYLERMAADDDDSDGWYAGKYLARMKKDVNDPSRRSRASAEQTTASSSEGHLKNISDDSEEAPKLLINIKVVGCRNLKSPLKRVITRPINAVVDVCVGDELRSTEVVNSNPNPMFTEKNSFLFGVPIDGVCEGFVEFTVHHKGLISFDVIGVARIPFAALRTLPVIENMEMRTDQCSHIILPLVFKEANVHAIGKGFYERSLHHDSTVSSSEEKLISSDSESEGAGKAAIVRPKRSSSAAVDEANQEQWYDEDALRKYMRNVSRARFEAEGEKKKKKIPTLYVQVSKHVVE